MKITEMKSIDTNSLLMVAHIQRNHNYSKNKKSEAETSKYWTFWSTTYLNDISVDNRLFQMVMYCAKLPVDLCLYSNEAELIQSLIIEKKEKNSLQRL